MTNYTINIDVADPGNLAGYYLTAFKGVGTSASNGQPTTWFTNGAPASKISVNWSESYQAYNADVEIIPNGTIKTSNPLNVDLGDQYAFGPGGVPTVTRNGPSPGAVTILNSSGKKYTVGLSQSVGGTYAALCAFPLNGGEFSLALTPVETVLLMWASRTINTGTVIVTGYSSGLLIDMTGAPQGTREVQYDTSNGWKLNNQAWTEQVAINTLLAGVLITPPIPTAFSRSRQIAQAQSRLLGLSGDGGCTTVANITWHTGTFILEDGNTYLSGTISVKAAVAVGFIGFVLSGLYFSISNLSPDGLTFNVVYNGTASVDFVTKVLVQGARVCFG
jgi:hypothetical protein